MGMDAGTMESFEKKRDSAGDSPAAASLEMRSRLLTAIGHQVRDWNVLQADAAPRLGITQPRLNDLLRGKIDKFSLEMLVNLAGQAGLSVRLEIAEPG